MPDDGSHHDPAPGVASQTTDHTQGDAGSKVHGNTAANQAYEQWVVANLEAGAAAAGREGVLASLYGMQAQLEAMFPCGGGPDATGVNWKEVAVGVGIAVGVTILTGVIGDVAAGIGGLLGAL